MNRVGVEKWEKCCLVSETLSALGFTIALYPVHTNASGQCDDLYMYIHNKLSRGYKDIPVATATMAITINRINCMT